MYALISFNLHVSFGLKYQARSGFIMCTKLWNTYVAYDLAPAEPIRGLLSLIGDIGSPE